MEKVYFSDIKTETWTEAQYMTYVIIPRKWWSIYQWIEAIKFSKSVQMFFMKKT